MDLSIIIVNWNSANYLRKCLETVFANIHGLDFEVIVVDNASYDGCGEILETYFPTVKFVQSAKNLGFAGANNLGFNHSSGENLLFLNPDTEVLGSAIQDMLHVLRTIPDAGAVGCRLLNTDGSLQTTCIQPFPTLLNQMLDTDFLILRFPSWKIWGVRPLFFGSDHAETVEVVTGACLLVRRSDFEKAGIFSSDYFMYGEDIDLCFKLVRSGQRNYYQGGASIVHHGGKSADQASFSHFNAVHKRDSVRIFFCKFRGPFQAHLYTFTTGLSAVARLIVILLSSPGAFLTRRRKRLGVTFKKWMTVLKWSLRGSRRTNEISLKGV